jgi:hypothetical protein
LQRPSGLLDEGNLGVSEGDQLRQPGVTKRRPIENDPNASLELVGRGAALNRFGDLREELPQ